MIAALTYAVIGLKAMHRMEDEIARADLSAGITAIDLHEIVVAQEQVVKKRHLLDDDELREIFRKNNRNFRSALTLLHPVYPKEAVASLDSCYAKYVRICEQVLDGHDIPSQELARRTEQLDREITRFRSDQQLSLVRKMQVAGKHETSIVSYSILAACAGVAASFIVSVVMTYSFASSIGKLQKATHRIADGEFDYDPGISRSDEIGALAQDFIRMASRLKELEQISLDASPLTRLPGNIAIERAINHRISTASPFAICYLDLDNFKSYNDRYGYIKASEVLKEVGQVIYSAAKRLGDPDLFVGHIGGDDFVIIITGTLAEGACRSIIHDVDAVMPGFYSAEDRSRGTIEGIDRYGMHRVFPLVSISIAVLLCSEGDYNTAAEIALAAARLKEQLKMTPGSNYIIVTGDQQSMTGAADRQTATAGLSHITAVHQFSAIPPAPRMAAEYEAV